MKDRQAPEDIWHLTLDDLWATPAEIPRLGGEGPFVINLSTSTAPIVAPPKNELHIENISVYVLTRTEDGRQRFRLRLGPISTELEADAIVSAVRERYPSAMTATAAEDDLRAIAGATRNTKGTRPVPPQAAKPAAKQGPSAPLKATPKPAQKTAPVNVAPPAPRPAAPKPVARPPAAPPVVESIAAEPAAQLPQAPVDPFAVILPPAPEIAPHDDSHEATGTGWEIDALIPHLAGPQPKQQSKPAAPKAAPVARKQAPPERPKAPQVAKPAAPKLATPPPKPAPVAPTTIKKTPAVADATKARKPLEVSVLVPPVLTDAVDPSKTVEKPRAKLPAEKPPILVVEKREALAEPLAPAAPIVAPVPAVEVVAPPASIIESKPVEPPVAAAPVIEAPVIAAPVIAPTVVEAPVVVVVAELAAIAPVTPAAIAPATVTPTAEKPAVVPPPLSTIMIPRVPVEAAKSVEPPHEQPPTDPLETDWASILSASVGDTHSRPVFQVPEPPTVPPVARAAEIAPAPAIAPEVLAVAPVVAASLTEPSAAPLPLASVPGAAPATAEQSPPAVIFSPLTTQTIEQKLSMLAELLHGDQTPSPSPAAETSASAPAAEGIASAPVNTAVAAPSEFDVEISFDDEMIEAPVPPKSWPEVDRRQDERPTLKSPTGVLSSIDAMVVVDEANNLVDVVARQAAAVEDSKVDSTAITDQVPVLILPVEAPIADEAAIAAAFGELEPAAPGPAPAIEAALAAAPSITLEPTPAAEAMPALVLALEVDLSPAPALTLAPVDPAPPPVLAGVVAAPKAEAHDDSSLESLVEKNNALVFALEENSRDAAPAVKAKVKLPVERALPELEFTIDEPAPPIALDVSVVPTVVLENPAPRPPLADEPHVPTIVLDSSPVAALAPPTTGTRSEGAGSGPVVIRSRESGDPVSKAAAHLSARASAKAAKKLRIAKDTAKKATPAQVQSSPAAPVKANPAPVAKEVLPAKPATPATLVKAPSAAQTPGGKPAPAIEKKSIAKPAPLPAKPAAPAAPARPAASQDRRVTIRSEHSRSMDSTQTIRALTPLELADDQVSKWYVIQLATSDEDFDPEHIPQLDIFAAFRLYSVMGLDGTKILHALRLGFFGDEISAQAVHGYLKAHFEQAAVKRVSIAERERFAESVLAARKDVGGTGMHAIIEMASPAPVRETRLADLASGSNPRAPEEKSIWSRMMSPLKRP